MIERLADRSIPAEERLFARGPLFAELVDQLSDDEAEELVSLLPAEHADLLQTMSPADQRARLLAVGIAHDRFGLRQRTGLSDAMPPAGIHAMTHAEWATGGDPWYADMIDTAFRECGLDLRGGGRVLDFGCSSGRVVRMLAARRSAAQWLGCDVNAEAVAWARAELPGIEFFDQPLRPPLPLEDATLDAAFAISIWSHYAEAPAATWLAELHRIIRPGGLALLTTHGAGAIAHRAGDSNHGEVAQRPVVVDLYRHGFAFVDVFGVGGDWGVVDAEWGTSFIDPEWMLRTVTPAWSVALYRPAAIDQHQDLWVLRREP